jgi:predicted GNAT family N-acyltransferase
MPMPLDASVRNSSYHSIAFTPRFQRLVSQRIADGTAHSYSASTEEVLKLMHCLRATLGSVASDEAALKVHAHNPDVMRVVPGKGNDDPAFLAYLPFNERGLEALASGTFDRMAPDISLLCKPDEQLSALYIWCIHTPGSFIPAAAAFARHLGLVAPHGAPMFARAATKNAARLFDAMGFRSALAEFPDASSDLLYVPAAAAPAPVITTRISRTIEDVMKVFSIRAATYMNEQACPYNEEFDGNDFCAAHILGEIDGEPAGCVRVRFFGDFVKIERLAVRPEFRQSRLAMKLARAAFDYARAKGFRKAYGHSRHDLLRFWARFGFKPMADRALFQFSDVDYVEIEADIVSANDVIAIGRPPLEMIRPEGEWDRPGPLDRSAMRGSRGEALQRRLFAPE